MKTKFQQIYDQEQFVPSILGLFLNPYYFIRNGISSEVTSNSDYLKGRLLDFGCGNKPYKKLIHAAEYVGVDISISGDCPVNKEVDVYYDGKTLPFGDCCFDTVFSSEVFEHIFNLDEIIKELHRVLKPNGYIFVTMPFVWDEHEIPYDFARYTSFGIASLLEKRGFKIIKKIKSGNYIQVIFQMIAAYVNQSILPLRVRKIMSPFFVAPIIIAGMILAKILPNNDNLFLNNIILAQKYSGVAK